VNSLIFKTSQALSLTLSYQRLENYVVFLLALIKNGKMSKSIITNEVITNKIYLIRGQKVMIDNDLAELYQVETRRLNEQIKRNIGRFPEDFMFRLTIEEWKNLKSQFATSSWGSRRNEPYAFTEHGILMLSSVLNSE